MVVVEEAYPRIVTALFKLEEGSVLGLLSNVKTKFGTIIFYCLWSGFGSPILIYLSSMNTISESVVDSAKIDGTNFFQQTIYITLPLIYPTIVNYLIVGISGIFLMQLDLFSFYGDAAETEIRTIGYFLYTEVLSANGITTGYPYLAAIGLVFTAICVPLTLITRKLLTKYGPSED